MEKYEENTKLKEYFEFYIKQMSVDEKYHPILVDILMRRTYEFELKSNEIQQDITSLINNLKKIRVGKMPEGYESAAGVYCSVEKEIILDETLVEQYKKSGKYDIIFEILTHEIYHALSRDENGLDRLASKNTITGYYNSTLLEAIVEKSADRTVFSRGDKDVNAPYYHQNVFGYSNITFIIDALAASYGFTEKDFLRHAIRGRDVLTNVLDDISKEKEGSANEFLDGIELNFAVLHKNFYRKNENKEIKPDRQEVLDSMKSMYNLCELKIQKRINKMEFNSIERAEFLTEFLKYGHNKLFIVMKDAVKGFEHSVGKGLTNEFLEGTIPSRSSTISIISEMSQLLENKEKFRSQEDLLRLINSVRTGTLSDDEIERLEYMGIKFKKPEEIFKVSDDFIEDRKKRDFLSTIWDKQKIKAITKQAFPKKKISERLKESYTNLKDKVKKIFGPKKKLLEPGQEDTKEQSDTSNTQAAFGELSKEQLASFKKGEEAILSRYNKMQSDNTSPKKEEKRRNDEGPII